ACASLTRPSARGCARRWARWRPTSPCGRGPERLRPTHLMARLADDQIQDFYEDCYTPGADGDKHRAWRELGAEGKADHVVELVAPAKRAAPQAVCEVGCGDGAVLGVLGRRGFGARRVGYEISASGVRLAAERAEVDLARVFDGAALPEPEQAYD